MSNTAAFGAEAKCNSADGQTSHNVDNTDTLMIRRRLPKTATCALFLVKLNSED